MIINPLIFRAYDIRGIAIPKDDTPADLTEDKIYLIGRAAGIYLAKKYGIKTMAVGCDNRLSSEKLKISYMQGLLDSGIHPTDIGLVTSPMVYWTTCACTPGTSLPFDSATNITASHNPKEYNGLKIVTKGAHSICGEELQEILKIIQNNSAAPASTASNSAKPPSIQAAFSTLDIWPQYLNDILARTKLASPRSGKHLRVVVDCGNGVAGKFAPTLLRALGCEIIELYCELDGNFPNHEANPEELRNMGDLIKATLENKADLGIGFDGDGDRVGIIDEKGHHYSSDFMLLLLARDLLTRLPNSKIVFDVKVSQAIINDLKKHGAIPIMSKTGHSFIEAKMKEIGAPLAGEVSGHLFFAENYYGFDDALFAAAKILEILSQNQGDQKPFSEFFADLPKTCTTPEFKAACPDDRKFAIISQLVAHFTSLYDCITIDGVRVNFDETSWGAIRASNTSPNLTIRFEALTPERLREIQEIMVTELQKYPEVSLDWYCM